jgi:hypothetical protein
MPVMYENWIVLFNRRHYAGGTVVVTEQSTHALSPANRAHHTLRLPPFDQFVAQPLVVSLAMIMRHDVGECPPKMAFTEGDDTIEAFPFWSSGRIARVGIAVGRTERRPHHSDTRRREEALDGWAPFPIPIAD